jgi:hypothetical protein
MANCRLRLPKKGDLVIIAGQSWPAKISRQRDNLVGLMHKHDFAQTVENVAYTWFNHFATLRYMEIHDYLSHGYRVLSSREGGLPEILGHAPELAQNGDLSRLNPQWAIELKLAGDQDGELYRLTLIARRLRDEGLLVVANNSRTRGFALTADRPIVAGRHQAAGGESRHETLPPIVELDGAKRR